MVDNGLMICAGGTSTGSWPAWDRRSRPLITLTAMHVRAAPRNGVTQDEIKELVLQTAIYCGVPNANTAFRLARRALDQAHQSPDEENP